MTTEPGFCSAVRPAQFGEVEKLWHLARMPMEAQLSALLETQEVAELGPGPRDKVLTKLEIEKQLTPFLQTVAMRGSRSELIRALILLWHDHLDAAHGIAQAIEDADGALVHAIMHRREPDFGNSAYWFRRAGRHLSFPLIASRVAVLLKSIREEELLPRLVPNGSWDPLAFVNVCQAASDRPGPSHLILRKVQREEFSAVLEYFKGP